MRMARPVHPGTFIRMEVIDAHELSITQAAEILGVTRPTLSSLLNARAALSPEMALRMEKAFGLSMETLLRMQTAYATAQTRARAGDIKVKKFVPARSRTIQPQ